MPRNFDPLQLNSNIIQMHLWVQKFRKLPSENRRLGHINWLQRVWGLRRQRSSALFPTPTYNLYSQLQLIWKRLLVWKAGKLLQRQIFRFSSSESSFRNNWQTTSYKANMSSKNIRSVKLLWKVTRSLRTLCCMLGCRMVRIRNNKTSKCKFIILRQTKVKVCTKC